MRWRLMLGYLLFIPAAVLVLTLAAGSGMSIPARVPDYVLRVPLPPAGRPIDLPKVQGPPDASRPLVVIDAGHGGHDPGAGGGDLREKDLTLRLARALRDELLREGGIRVAMTRDEDRYLMLTERSSIARRLKADLFLSIHADSVETGEAHGASIYVLSEKGSSQAASRIAARENRADVVNGVQLADTSDAVSAILVDLSQRETLASSSQFARLVLRELQGGLPLRGDQVQSAAFVVLKSPDLPSVLFEAGYISNPEDKALLASPEGQQTFARAAARAIRAYFARRSGAFPSR